MKAEILKILKKEKDYVSGQELCESLGVSRTAVWKAIRQLEEQGYVIEAVRNKGYRLVEEADVLTVAELHSVLDTKWLGKELEYYYETDSTNKGCSGKRCFPRLSCSGRLPDSRKGPQGKSVEFPSWNRYLYEFRPASYIYPIPGVYADAGSGNGSGKRGTESHGLKCHDQMA